MTAAMSATYAAPVAERSAVLVRRLLRDHVRRHGRRIAIAMAAMTVGGVATAGLAWLMQPALDRVFIQRDVEMLVIVPVAVVLLTCFKGGAAYLQEVLVALVGQQVVADLQKTMYAHLLQADLAFYAANSTGALVSRFTTDLQLLREALARGLVGVARDAVTLGCLVGVMFWQDWRLATVAFFVFPAAVVPIVRVGRRLRTASAQAQERAGSLAGLIEQAFQGARHVKAYGREDHEAARAGLRVDTFTDALAKTARLRTATRPVMEALTGIAVASVVVYGGGRVLAGTTTPGTFFSFVAALMMAYQPLKGLASLNAVLQEGLAAAQRVFDLIDLQPQIQDRHDASDLRLAGGEVRFENVWFGYETQPAALRGANFVAAGGRTTALVGPSGAGKSTILNLVPRFFDVDEGRVTIDGQDVRDVTLTSLREAIAIVTQEPALFDDTVRANIAYGRAHATDADITAAAVAAGADDFIRAMPLGYETMVGEQGQRLSGGQRQRIAIARAMLKDAPILLLDEATSALDSESEAQVQAALRRLMAGRTCIVIAHRLSTIADADLIHVVEDGQIVESGSHGALVASQGLYARLHGLQFRTPAARCEGTA
jgi:subfamily B ATP-binding cassette protein MsbA